MPSPNNLRIIYNNLVDLSATTITASSSQSASTGVSNLKTDTKSLVWRSSPTTVASTTVKANLVVDLGSSKNVGGVVLAFTNLNSNTATIRVIGYSALPTLGGDVNNPTITGTTVAGYNTGNVVCSPWNTLNLPEWGTTPSGSSNYSYGGGTYARVWMPSLKSTPVRYLTIEITDNYATSASGRYIEVSRLIIGDYWSPVYNTGYGMTNTIKDLSEHERTQGGDLVTQRGPRFSALSFNLDWLNHTDRVEAARLMLGNGISKPILVSLFPDSTGDVQDFERERSHQIYGKFMQIPGITYQNIEFYSLSLELEEV
jgi:hypothetical protein